jgi:hypothetical protein
VVLVGVALIVFALWVAFIIVDIVSDFRWPWVTYVVHGGALLAAAVTVLGVAAAGLAFILHGVESR